MGVLKKVAERMFSGTIERAVEDRLPAAASQALDDIQWRRLTGNSVRELPVATWQRQVEICYWLWKTNPLANWIVEILAALTAGKGFTYTAKNPDVKKIMDDFWYDAINRMDIKLEQKVRELSIFGLQCWPVFRSEQTGRIRLGMVDPGQVVQVVADPENAEVLIGVAVQNIETGKERKLKTILIGETETVISQSAKDLRDKYTDGECFLIAINRVSNDPYGTSDLFAIADWLNEYEEFVFATAEKAKKQNNFIYDVTVQNADDKQCDAMARQFARNPDGAVRVHNEKVTWQAVAPNLKSVEMKEAAGVFRLHIISSKCIPPHWYGGAMDVNRAAAKEGNEPMKALIDARQNLVKFILETMFTTAIQGAIDAGYLHVPEDEAFDFAVQKPETMERDVSLVSGAVKDLTAAIVAAETQGLIDEPTAVKMFAHISDLIGFEIHPDSMDLTQNYQDYKKTGTSPDAKPQPDAQPGTAG